MSDRSLAGLRVWVTRPTHQAASLCSAIEAEGGSVVRLPLLAIERVADREAAQRALTAARTAAAWLFTSTNAVDFAQQLHVRPWPAHLAAAGEATGAALRRLGHTGVQVPAQGDGAAALLALPEFAAIQGQSLAIIGGEQPLPDLAQGLAARGAKVNTIPVYRRRALRHDAATLAAALDAAEIAIVTSAAALAALLDTTPAALRDRLLDLPLALPSQRVVEKAREAGFRHEPLVPTRVTDSDWLDLLQRWRRARRNHLK